MKKILKSTAMIVAVGAIVVGATMSFFSDEETSEGNTFEAGAIDLSLGGNFSSTSNGNPGLSELLADNDGRVLYTFTDLKPGDMGGGSFNLEVNTNDAYVCAKSEITSNPENGVNDPELDASDTADNGPTDGELQDYLQFATFDDENENGVYDAGEDVNVGQYGGDGNGITVAELEAAGWVAVADTTYPNTWLVEETVPANTPQSAGMLYCFGDFTTTGTLNDVVVTGCDGSGDQNIAQTDGLVGSIEFYATQTRNNEGFECSSMNPVFELTEASEQNPINEANGDKPWYSYEVNGLCIDFTLHNPTTRPAYFDFAIDGNPGTFYAGLSDITITEGPLDGTLVGNLYSNTQVSAGQTVVDTRCGDSEIKVGIHFGAEQLWYLDWATFTAQ